MGRRATLVTLIGVALVAGGFIAVVMSASHRTSAGAKADTVFSGVGLLDTAQTAADPLPPAAGQDKIGAGGLLPSSVRMIQSGTAGAVWVGVDHGGHLCLIASTPTSPATFGSACTTQAQFTSRALSVRVGDAGGAIEAYLYPDEHTKELSSMAIDQDATISVYSDLILLNPAATADQRAAFAKASADVFDLGILPDPV